MHTIFFRIAITAFLLTLSCGAEQASEQDVDVSLYGDNKADVSMGTTQLGELIWPATLDWQDTFLLPPGAMIGVAVPGQNDTPFRISAEPEGTELDNDLEMAHLMGDGPEIGQAEQQGTSGSWWWAPAFTIHEPEEGLWYFFIIKNVADEAQAIFVELEASDSQSYGVGRMMFWTDHSVRTDQPLCPELITNPGASQVGGATIGFRHVGGYLDLSPQHEGSYTIMAAGEVEFLEIFEADAVLRDRNISPPDYYDPFNAFIFPDITTARVQRIAAASPDTPTSVTFDVRPGKLYVVAVHQSWLDHQLSFSSFMAHLWMCEGADSSTCAETSCTGY